jgi:hypothetical protein
VEHSTANSLGKGDAFIGIYSGQSGERLANSIVGMVKQKASEGCTGSEIQVQVLHKARCYLRLFKYDDFE